MTYIFKAIFIVQFKILNPKKAQLTSKQNIKYPLHVNSYMIANSVEEQMVVSFVNFAPQGSGNSFQAAETEKKEHMCGK